MRDGDPVPGDAEFTEQEAMMVAYSLQEKRAIAWRLRAEGVPAREIGERYGWGRPVIYSWGRDKKDWERLKQERSERAKERYRTDPEYRHKRSLWRKEWWAENRERVLTAERERRKNDPEFRARLNKKAREYNKANPGRRAARDRERYQNNPEYRKGILAASKAWQDAHPEEHRKRSREWYRRHAISAKHSTKE